MKPENRAGLMEQFDRIQQMNSIEEIQAACLAIVAALLFDIADSLDALKQKAVKEAGE